MLFNAPTAGALHVENLKGASGEVALRLGENEPFGVINVGDDTKLVRLCEREGIEVAEREFAGSLFLTINRTDSTVQPPNRCPEVSMKGGTVGASAPWG